jgi:hypothetical protein
MKGFRKGLLEGLRTERPRRPLSKEEKKKLARLLAKARTAGDGF